MYPLVIFVMCYVADYKDVGFEDTLLPLGAG